MKLQRTLGTASIAAKEKDDGLALTKIEQLAKELGEWKRMRSSRPRRKMQLPLAPEQAPQPAEQSNRLFDQLDICPRQVPAQI